MVSSDRLATSTSALTQVDVSGSLWNRASFASSMAWLMIVPSDAVGFDVEGEASVGPGAHREPITRREALVGVVSVFVTDVVRLTREVIHRAPELGDGHVGDEVAQFGVGPVGGVFGDHCHLIQRDQPVAQ